MADLADRVGVNEEGVADESDDVQRSSSLVLVAGSAGIGHDWWGVTQVGSVANGWLGADFDGPVGLICRAASFCAASDEVGRWSEMDFYDVIDKIGEAIDGAGVIVIVVGAVIAFAAAVVRLTRREADVYRRFRELLGRTILVGLELLVAGDIVRTVAATPTLTSVTVLGGIVPSARS